MAVFNINAIRSSLGAYWAQVTPLAQTRLVNNAFEGGFFGHYHRLEGREITVSLGVLKAFHQLEEWEREGRRIYDKIVGPPRLGIEGSRPAKGIRRYRESLWGHCNRQ